MRLSLRLLPALWLASFLAACDSSPSEPPGGTAVATIEVSPSPIEVVRGNVVDLVVTLRDARGNELAGRPVTFQSSAQGVASVSPQGRVEGVQAGTAIITVRSGEGRTDVPVAVLPGSEPAIESVSATALAEGQTVEITGLRFATATAQNVVRLDDELLEVLEASAERLRVRVPAQLCLPTGPAQLTVEVGGDRSAPHPTSFQAPAPLAVAPGGFHLIPGGSARCLRLPGGSASATYLVGIQNITTVAEGVVEVGYRGKAAGAPVASPPLAPRLATAAARSFHAVVRERALRSASAAAPSGSSAEALAGIRERHRAEELRLREASRALVAPRLEGARAYARSAAAGARSPAPAPATVPATAQPGDTVNLNVPDIAPGRDFCQTGIPIKAVVRRVGPRTIWVEDVANPGGGLSGADYTALGERLDDQILPILEETFGEPTDLDGNDRVVVVITREVNRFGGILGFVVSTDLFPASGANSCPASNEGEFYYSLTPDPDGLIPVPAGRQQLRLSVEDFRVVTPSLAAHEMTHVIQFGRRLLTPGATSFATLWEAEGGAMIAEEVVGLHELGLGSRQNLGFDVAFNGNGMQEHEWFVQHFVDLAVYYGFESPTARTANAPSACGWLSRDDPASAPAVSGPCDYPRLFYGVAWSFLRWLADHRGVNLPGGEAAFFRGMVEATQTGFGAVEQVLGEPVAPLLGAWAASLYTDGRVTGGADPRLTFPSWNLRGIDQGLVATAHLQPEARSFASFSGTRPVAAGSSHYLLLSGVSRPEMAIRVLEAIGGELPSTVQIWVARVQ